MLSTILINYCKYANNLLNGTAIKRLNEKSERAVSFLQSYPEVFLEPGANLELAIACARHHNDGRKLQYSIQGNFDDKSFAASSYGEKMLFLFLLEKGLPFSPIPSGLSILQYVMLYSEKWELLEGIDIPTNALPYVVSVGKAYAVSTAIDWPMYIEEIIQKDYKGYSYNHCIKYEIWISLLKGENFSKDLVDTYDEYLLFLLALSVNAIKKYDFVADVIKGPSFIHDCIVDGMKAILRKYLLIGDAQRAISILDTSLSG